MDPVKCNEPSTLRQLSGTTRAYRHLPVTFWQLPSRTGSSGTAPYILLHLPGERLCSRPCLRLVLRRQLRVLARARVAAPLKGTGISLGGMLFRLACHEAAPGPSPSPSRGPSPGPSPGAVERIQEAFPPCMRNCDKYLPLLLVGVCMGCTECIVSA